MHALPCCAGGGASLLLALWCSLSLSLCCAAVAERAAAPAAAAATHCWSATLHSLLALSLFLSLHLASFMEHSESHQQDVAFFHFCAAPCLSYHRGTWDIGCIFLIWWAIAKLWSYNIDDSSDICQNCTSHQHQ